ncbi:hypothetical protein SNEBB_009801 [Seison nebaliae]|nr:hypothetical protein SNEBB_009801 [Seison nebaliae]
MLLMDSKHATYESRLASFRNSPFERWTRLKNTKCSPENLAKAGFFYAPTKHGEKTVKCYYCGKMLGDWKRSEDPWEEQLVRNCELFQMYKKYKYDILPFIKNKRPSLPKGE